MKLQKKMWHLIYLRFWDKQRDINLAVYTDLNKEQLTNFISSYDIGNLICFNGITEGIENSNFYVKTSHDEFILTIFEKRVHIKDIPFFINIMLFTWYLVLCACCCPSIMISTSDLHIGMSNNKKDSIKYVSYGMQ